MDSMTPIPREALALWLQHAYSEEESSYAEMLGMPRWQAAPHARKYPQGKHIFTALVQVSDWLASTAKPVAGDAPGNAPEAA